MKKMFGRIMIALVAVAMVVETAPAVFANEPELVPDPEPVEIEEIMESIEIEPLMAESEEGLTVSPNKPGDETGDESTPDPSVLENEVPTTEAPETTIPAGKKMWYYPQPEWYVNSGYDAVTAYVTDDSGKYAKRCFLVTDGSEWILYNYKELEAAEYFSKVEFKNEMYIPVQKKEARKNNPNTAELDESKIPTLTQQAWNGLGLDWMKFDQIPFTRDKAGKIVYAGELVDDDTNTGEDDPEPTPAPTPSSDQVQHVVTINNNVYDVRITKSVVYNGKKHVLSTAKATKSQTPDIQVSVYRNDTLLEPNYYAVKFFNNVNVNGYGKSGSAPYLTVTLKGKKELKADKELLASNPFGFDILPADIGTLDFSVKKVSYTSSTGKLTLNAPKVKIDGVVYKLAPRTAKNRLTGSYVAGYRDGKVLVYGVNNYAGVKEIDLLSAKTIDWSF